MSDNIELNTGSGGATLATDDVGGIQYQRVKLAPGAVGTNVQRVTLASDDPAVVALQILDNIVSGSEAQVDIVAALPAGTNNIGDVDVLSVVPGTGATNLGKAEDAAHSSGDVGVMALGVRQDTQVDFGADGDYVPLSIDAAGGARVSVISGGIAGAVHDSAAASEGVQSMYEARSAEPTAVTAGDAVRAQATLLGKQIVYPYAIPASTWSYASPAAVADTADDEAKAATASTRHYVTSLQVFNADATVGTEVVLKDGSTVMWRGYAVAVGGGAAVRFDPPLRGTANTAWNVANITTSAETYFNLQGFSSAE
jgi:hypothetical protein